MLDCSEMELEIVVRSYVGVESWILFFLRVVGFFFYRVFIVVLRCIWFWNVFDEESIEIKCEIIVFYLIRIR